MFKPCFVGQSARGAVEPCVLTPTIAWHWSSSVSFQALELEINSRLRVEEVFSRFSFQIVCIYFSLQRRWKSFRGSGIWHCLQYMIHLLYVIWRIWYCSWTGDFWQRAGGFCVHINLEERIVAHCCVQPCHLPCWNSSSTYHDHKAAEDGTSGYRSWEVSTTNC